MIIKLLLFGIDEKIKLNHVCYDIITDVNSHICVTLSDHWQFFFKKIIIFIVG